MRAYRYKHGPEVYAIIGNNLLSIRWENDSPVVTDFTGSPTSINAVGVSTFKDGQEKAWHAWANGRCTPISEEEFKNQAKPVPIQAALGGNVITDQVIELRAAQRNYYASRNPNEKYELLKKARACEDKIDKIIRRLQAPEWPLFPPPKPSNIA